MVTVVDVVDEEVCSEMDVGRRRFAFEGVTLNGPQRVLEITTMSNDRVRVRVRVLTIFERIYLTIDRD